jgi:hypothetical protein
MQKFIQKYKFHFLGALLGAVAGFLYWRFVGCNSGTCPITSKWHNSTLYGVLMGYLIVSAILDSRKKKVENQEPVSNDEQ